MGSDGILMGKDSNSTVRTGNIMNVQDLSSAYKLNPAQLHNFRQLVIAGDDSTTNIYQVLQFFAHQKRLSTAAWDHALQLHAATAPTPDHLLHVSVQLSCKAS